MNRLQQLEQQLLEEGREWTRRRLQERLQKEIEEMGSGMPSKRTNVEESAAALH